MEKLTTEKAQQIIKEYIEKMQNSEDVITIDSIIEQNFISQYMPKNAYYKATEDVQEKINQFIKILEIYNDYTCLLKQISNGKRSEILSVLFSYDIIKNGKMDNKDSELEKLISIFKFDSVPEYEEKIKYYAGCYFGDIAKSRKRYEDVTDVLNKILTKKFAYNLYSYLTKKQPITMDEKVQRLKKAFETIKELGAIQYTDLYEDITDIMKEYGKDNDLINNQECYEKAKNMIEEFYTTIDFPQFFTTVGDTPEQILLQSICSSKEQNLENPEYIMNILKFLNESGDKIGKFRRNVFFSELIKNMQTSFNNLIENENDEKIKECIKLYSKAKYTGKLDFALQQRTEKRKRGNFNVAVENPTFVDMEEKMSKKIIEFSKKDYDGCIKFLEEIPEFVVQESDYISKYNFRDNVLPEIMGIQLSREEKVILEGKDSFKKIMRYLKAKVKNKKSTDDMGEYSDSGNVLE